VEAAVVQRPELAREIAGASEDLTMPFEVTVRKIVFGRTS